MESVYNVNKFIFSRVSPKKKVEVINNLSDVELRSISKDTIIKIIKESGTTRYKSHDKSLYIAKERREGNDWNSAFESIEYSKKELWINLYVQYGNTDRNCVSYYDNFFGKKGDYHNSFQYNDRYGLSHVCNIIYTEEDKAKCIRSILLEYLYIKYTSKLSA